MSFSKLQSETIQKVSFSLEDGFFTERSSPYGYDYLVSLIEVFFHKVILYCKYMFYISYISLNIRPHI